MAAWRLLCGTPETPARMVEVATCFGNILNEINFWLKTSLEAQVDYAHSTEQYVWFTRERWNCDNLNRQEIANKLINNPAGNLQMSLVGIRLVEVMLSDYPVIESFYYFSSP